jgi:hypothetical protein
MSHIRESPIIGGSTEKAILRGRFGFEVSFAGIVLYCAVREEWIEAATGGRPA